MQQRPVRYYITQDEDQAVVRSVPVSRRVQAVLPQDERAVAPQQDEQPIIVTPESHSVADRVRAVVRRTGSAGRR
jgi:hypothetical protein